MNYGDHGGESGQAKVLAIPRCTPGRPGTEAEPWSSSALSARLWSMLPFAGFHTGSGPRRAPPSESRRRTPSRRLAGEPPEEAEFSSATAGGSLGRRGAAVRCRASAVSRRMFASVVFKVVVSAFMACSSFCTSFVLRCRPCSNATTRSTGKAAAGAGGRARISPSLRSMLAILSSKAINRVFMCSVVVCTLFSIAANNCDTD